MVLDHERLLELDLRVRILLEGLGVLGVAPLVLLRAREPVIQGVF